MCDVGPHCVCVYPRVLRVSSLLQQQGLGLSVQQVIVQRCCELPPVWDARVRTGREPGAREGAGAFGMDTLTALLRQHAQEHLAVLGLSAPEPEPLSDPEASPEESSAASSSTPASPSSPTPSSSSSSSASFLLTPSALSFLKSRSPLTAALACLSACRSGGVARATSGWSGLPSYFRGAGRKEAALDGEAVSREGEALLREFPVLQAHLQAMAEPVLGPGAGAEEAGGAGAGLGAALCGKPLMGLLLSGLYRPSAWAIAGQAFQQALESQDLERALSLLELYGQGCGQQGALRDRLLAWAALEGEEGGVGWVCWGVEVTKNGL